MSTQVSQTTAETTPQTKEVKNSTPTVILIIAFVFMLVALILWLVCKNTEVNPNDQTRNNPFCLSIDPPCSSVNGVPTEIPYGTNGLLTLNYCTANYPSGPFMELLKLCGNCKPNTYSEDVQTWFQEQPTQEELNNYGITNPNGDSRIKLFANYYSTMYVPNCGYSWGYAPGGYTADGSLIYGSGNINAVVNNNLNNETDGQLFTNYLNACLTKSSCS